MMMKNPFVQVFTHKKVLFLLKKIDNYSQSAGFCNIHSVKVRWK